ncbi:MAG: pre-peptidase C-terminal domain-containing protein [Ardenticatenaceae bacterium]|nr:pre-peptidase C-terminal domain-containing protein [Ardenticatenaceae bacterium]
MSTTRSNPYVGPETFKEEDKAYFFGRKQEAQELLSLVISEPLVLFYAQSGAGKSSLLNTCLIPDLREEDFHVLSVGRVSGHLPEGITAVPNIYVFNLLLSLCKGNHDVQELAQLSLTEYLESQKRNVPKDQFGQPKARVLIIDQFEEILTTHLGHWQERHTFFEQLNQALLDDPMLWVVLSMREDHIAALDPYAPLLPDKLRARFYMQRMAANAALEAVEGPAKENGRPFEHTAAQELVDNLRQIRARGQETPGEIGQFVEPVQLQLVCYQLWEEIVKKGAVSITHDDVEILADVDQALAEYYEKVIRQVVEDTDTSELRLRTWFQNKLITKGETRGIVPEGDTSEFSQSTIDLLQTKFLLRRVNRAGSNWYELVHDRFIGPISQANREWFQNNPYYRDAERWQTSKDPHHLYEGRQLLEAREQAAKLPPDPILQEFLDTSYQEEQKRKEEARKQQEARRKEAEREQEEKRRTLVLRGVSVSGVIVLLLAMFAAWQAVRATQNAELAVEQRGTAEANAILAVEQQGTAEASAALAATNADRAIASANLAITREAEAQAAQLEAQENLQLAQASQLAFHSNNNLSSDPQLSRLLAVEASRIITTTSSTNVHIAQAIQDTEQTINDALSQALENAQLQASWFASADFPVLAFDPHGRFLQTTSNYSIRLWTIPEGKEHASLNHTVNFRTTAFSQDGRWLAAIDANNSLLIWDMTCLADTQRIRIGPQVCLTTETQLGDGNEGDPRLFMQFSPDGRLLAIGGASNPLNLWNTSGETPLPSSVPIKLQSRLDMTGLAFSPDSTQLAIGFAAKSDDTDTSETGIVEIWDSAENNLQGLKNKILLEDLGGLGRMSFINENQIAILYQFGIAQIWTLENTRTKKEGEFGATEVIAFSPNGQQIAASDSRGGIELWNLSNLEEPSATLQEHYDLVRVLAFSPDGSKLVSTGYDGRVLLWDTVTLGFQELNSSRMIYDITALTFSPDGQWLSAIRTDGTAYMWNTTPSQPIWRTSTQPAHQVPAIALDSNGRFLALSNHVTSTLGSPLPALTLWDVAKVGSSNFTQSAIAARIDQDVPIVAAAFSPNRSLLATSAVATDKSGRPFNSTITLHNLPITDGSSMTLTQQSGETSILAFHPNGQWLAASHVISSTVVQTSTLQLWPLPTNGDILTQPVAAWDIEGALIGFSFSPDGRLLATSSQISEDVFIQLWDVSDTEALDSPVPLSSPLRLRNSYWAFITPRAIFSPDSSLLIAADADDLFMWQVDDLRQGSETAVFTLPGFGSPLTAFAFNPNGTRLAAGDANGVIHIWETSDLYNQNDDARTVEFGGQRGAILNLDYTPDGRWLISRSSDLNTHLWRLETTELASLTCQFTTRNLTQSEWDTYLVLTGNETYQRTCENLPPHSTALIALFENGLETNNLTDALVTAQQLGATVEEIRSTLLTFIETVAKTEKYDVAENIVIQARQFNSDLTMNTEVVATIFAQTQFDHGLAYAMDWEFDQAQEHFEAAQDMLKLAPESLRQGSSSDTVVTLLREARNVALDGNLDEALALLELARTIDPDVEENEPGAVAAIYQQNCRTYLAEGNVEDGEFACQEATRLAVQTENASMAFELCLIGAEFGHFDLTQDACDDAIENATNGDALTNFDICTRGSHYPDLEPIITPACEAAVEVVYYDPYYSLDLCRTVIQLGLTDVIADACEPAIFFSQDTGDFAFPVTTCQATEALGVTLDACVATAAPQAIAYGETIAGSFNQPSGYELWYFTGTTGEVVTITMIRTDENLDPYLYLLGPSGEEIASNDDGAGDLNSLISLSSLPQSGTYTIVARGYGSSFGSYELTLQLEGE